MATNSNSEANEYFPQLIEWESEGERSPSQVRVVSLDYISGATDSPFGQVESES